MWLSVILFVVLIAGIWLGKVSYPQPHGQKQPIPFSHNIHAGRKEISCMVCHPEAALGSTGGIPPLTTCMHCHSRIIVSYAPVRKLYHHFYTKEPLEWKKVTDVPEFVYFPHSVHLHRSVDCARCHGDVKKMDRIAEVNKMDMGFCMSCHRNYNVSTDCFTCHR